MAGKSGGSSAFMRRYLFNGMAYMGLGLYASLMLCLTFQTLSGLPFLSFLSPIGDALSRDPALLGAVCGGAVAGGLGCGLPALAAAAVSGALGYRLGGPLCCYLAALACTGAGKLLSGRAGGAAPLLIPLAGLLAGGFAACLTGPWLTAFMGALGRLINSAVALHPALMGMVVGVLGGMCATAPLGAPAICLSLGLNGLAAGAACAGCSAQMVGFALCSYRENRLGGALSLGLGTAMLEFGNVLRRPLIWLPGILASAVTGPLSAAVFGLKNSAVGAGMGTSGLVGQICAFKAMAASQPPLETLILLLLAHFVLPAILALGTHMLLCRAGLIRSGDMKLPPLG